MKMQQTLRAEWTGIVREVHVQSGQQVQGGDQIVTLE
jgi:biotin carboxyl carrier protein